MSLRPVSFNADGSIDVVFDELGHSGTIAAADVHYAVGLDGAPDHNHIVLDCPDGCGSQSAHPVGGGAAPVEVQQMFVNQCQSSGCPCGQVAASDPNALGESHVRLQVNRMDGPGRWMLE